MQEYVREKLYLGAVEPMATREETSLPKSFLEKMEQLLGEEFPDFLNSYEEERRFGLRMNPLKGTAGLPEFVIEEKKIPWAKEGYYYEPEMRPGKHPLHEAGLYYIQEPSAMAVAEALEPVPGEKILDLCAAPGGKTTHIAGKMAGSGLLVSNEIHPARAKILSQNVERMGICNAVVTNEDPVRLSSVFSCFFDGIVVDAPCSGEGMFRKDQGARAEWSPNHVILCAERQAGILDCAAGMLKPGGRIVYSTCTFSPEENEGVIAGFLKRHPEFTVKRPSCAQWFSKGHPEWVCREQSDSLACLWDTVRIWPHKVDGEGHFLALLVKEGAAAPGAEGAAADRKKKKSREPAGQEEFLKFCWETLREMPSIQFSSFGENLYRIPGEMPFLDGLRVLRPGLHLGTLKKGRFEPSHALALALKKEDVRLSAEIGTGETARRYLRGEAIEAVSTDCTDPSGKGWVLITACGCSLGFAKLSGGILKNHYPKGLRQP